MNRFYYLLCITSFYLYVMGVTFFPYTSVFIPLYIGLFSSILAFWGQKKPKLIPVLGVTGIGGLLAYVLFQEFAAVILFLIPTLYCALLKETRLPSYEAMKQRFTFGLCALLVFAFLHVFLHVGTTYFVFLLLYAASGMCALRSIRVKSIRNEKEFQKQNLLTLAVSLLASIPFTIPGVYRLLRNVILRIYLMVFYPIIRAVMSLFQTIMEMIADSTGLFTFERNVSSQQAEGLFMDDVGEKNVEVIWRQLDPGSIWILRIIGIVLLMIVLFVIVRYFQRQKRWMPEYQSEGVQYLRETIAEEKLPRGNRGKIRKIYKQYLQYLKKNHVQLEIGFTSQQIQKESDLYLENKEAAAQMRELYMKARYDLHHDVTRSEVNQMKKAFTALKHHSSERTA